ncbi:MAG: outer membrane beta-barrel protein [Calditrichaceae bacterium]
MDKLHSCVYLSILFILLIYQSIIAQNKTSIAILALQGNGISTSEASILTDELRSVLVQTGKYDVLERNNMESILNEQGFQMSGCTSTECAVEAGKLLGVQKMVGGSVGKLGTLYNISIRIFDVQTGRIEKTETKRHEGSIEQLLDLIKQIGYALTDTSIDISNQIESKNTRLQKEKMPNQPDQKKSMFSIKAGISSTTTTRHSADKIGFVIGGAFRYTIVNNFGIQSELFYATKHFEYFDSEETMHFDNLQIMFLLSYNVILLKNSNIILNFNAGPSYNHILNATKKSYGETLDLKNYDDASVVKSSEFTFVFGPGLQIPLGAISISIEGRYELGLTEIFKDESSWEVGKSKVIWGVLGITF